MGFFDKLKKAIMGAGRTVEHGAEKAGRTVEHGAEKAGSTVEHGAEKAGSTVEHGAEKAGRTVEHGAEKAGKEPMNPEDINKHEPTAVKRDKNKGSTGEPI